MKIYISNLNINTNELDNYYNKYYNNFKMIYSDCGIFRIENDSISKLNIIDGDIETIHINNVTLLVDNSIVSRENGHTTIPYKHNLVEINEIIYKKNKNSIISLITHYNKNKMIDVFFEVNNNILDNNIMDDLTNYLKII
jgi:hypothetical protein